MCNFNQSIQINAFQPMIGQGLDQYKSCDIIYQQIIKKSKLQNLNTGPAGQYSKEPSMNLVPFGFLHTNQFLEADCKW